MTVKWNHKLDCWKLNNKTNFCSTHTNIYEDSRKIFNLILNKTNVGSNKYGGMENSQIISISDVMNSIHHLGHVLMNELICQIYKKVWIFLKSMSRKIKKH